MGENQVTCEVAERESFDAVVVGSGIGGMTAAAYLAAGGKRTLVLEAYDVIGGSTHVFRRAGKWEFDVGTHYLADCGPDGVMPTILRGVGLDKSVSFNRLDDDGFDVIVLPDREVKVPVGWDRFRASLAAAFPGEDKAIRHITGVLEGLGKNIDHVTTPRSLLGQAKYAAKSGLVATWALRPLSHLLDSVEMSSGLKAALGVHYGTYSSPPTRTPVTVHALMMHSFMTTGAWFPQGGGQVFSARRGEVVLANGGEIRTRTPVAEILVSDKARMSEKRVTGVRLADGHCIDAPIVVSNADIKSTYTQLLDPRHVSKRTLKRVAKYRMSQPFFNTYIGLDVELRQTRPRSNYYSLPTSEDVVSIYQDLAENRFDRSVEDRLDEAMKRLPAFIHVASVKDPDNPRLSPPGCSTVQIMTTIPAEPEFWGLAALPESRDAGYQDDPEYVRIKERLTDVMIARLVEAIPEAEGHVVWREAATPMTQHRYTGSSDGTAYGLEMSINQFGPFRPGVGTEIDGLLLCGASYSWGPTVLGAMLSGLHAAGKVLGRDLYADAKSGMVYGDVSTLRSEAGTDALREAKAVATRPSRRAPAGT